MDTQDPLTPEPSLTYVVPPGDSIVEGIVAALSAALDAPPIPDAPGERPALAPLYDVIDPDALDALVTGMAAGSVQFDYAGCAVVVDSERVVRVTDAPLADEPTTGTCDGTVD